MAGAGADLDALLDDALEGFDRALPGREVAAAVTAAPLPLPPPAGSNREPAAHEMEEAWAEAAGPAGVSTSAPAAPASSSSAASSSSLKQPRGLAFDPLPRKPRRAPAGIGGAGSSGAAAPAAAPASAEAAEEEEGLDVLSQGLSRLLQELAAAEEEAPGGEAAAAAVAGGSSGGEAGAARPPRDLHATLRALSEQAPSFAGAGGEPESEEAMLRLLAEHLGALGGEAGGPAAGASGGSAGAGTASGTAPPEVASLMDSLMQQLLSKDVLYQPMKDIGEKYPAWLEAHKDTLSEEDAERYRQQYGFIQRICQLYETNPSDFPQLVDLLQQMQQCGQPPQEIVDELAPGMQFGPDGLPTFGSGSQEGLPPELQDCAIQ